MAIYISKDTDQGTPPEIIGLTEAKNHLKVDFDDDNDLITGFIGSAIEDAENYTGTNIKEAKYTILAGGWIQNMEIHLSPVQSIETVKYYDDNNDIQTLDALKYKILQKDKFCSIVYFTDPDNLPDVYEKADTIEIKLTTGYADGKTPFSVMAAIKLILGDLYENREDRPHGLPSRARALLRQFRFFY